MTDDLRPTNSRTGEVMDVPLIDDLAEVLSRMVVGWEPHIGVDMAQHPSVVRVMARYRAYKAEDAVHIIEIRDGGWLIQHPQQERLGGTLFDCGVTWNFEGTEVRGRFEMVWDEEADEWVLGKRVD